MQRVRNQAARHQLDEVMALVQEQLADIAAVQKKQAQLTTSAAVADGMVEVAANGHGHVVKTVIDESYLDEHELDELADHITKAAQAAAREAAQRMAEMTAPISKWRMAFPSLSETVEGAPDLRDLAPPGRDPISAAGPRQGADGDDGADETPFPTVRR
jgi:DNA-binding protein YbaB